MVADFDWSALSPDIATLIELAVNDKGKSHFDFRFLRAKYGC
jgi:hypothetical protein